MNIRKAIGKFFSTIWAQIAATTDSPGKKLVDDAFKAVEKRQETKLEAATNALRQIECRTNDLTLFHHCDRRRANKIHQIAQDAYRAAIN